MPHELSMKGVFDRPLGHILFASLINLIEKFVKVIVEFTLGRLEIGANGVHALKCGDLTCDVHVRGLCYCN